MSTSVSVVKNLNTLGNDHLKQDVVRDIAKNQDIVRLWSEVARAGIVLASIKLSQANCIAQVFINSSKSQIYQGKPENRGCRRTSAPPVFGYSFNFRDLLNMVISDLAGFGLESRKSKNKMRLLKLKVSTYVTK